ncbi:M16 family metallopeptidase [Paenibacillus sp. y28]|uniref:M16 family metallopeptidase n=1 Tax=Paenibacillus sp. y28 TaxID=3129110 RepID=UPI00301A8D72
MEKVTLSNGLRLVLEQIPTCRSVSFGIWVKTGSRNEIPDNNGISHCIEHMLFKGTDRHSAKDIADVFDGIGGNVNAFTSKEYTCYYAKVLDEHLPIAVEVLADMFFNSRIDTEELEKEKNVIIEEISMYEDTPDDLVHDLIARAAYGKHPLGYSILGTEANLVALQPHSLKQYMQERYTVSDTVISVAGNIDDRVVELIERFFGAFAAQGGSIPTEAAPFHSETIFHGKKTEQNHICLALPGCAFQDPDVYPMVLLNNAIGGGMSSRLFQEIREKRGLAYSVYSYHSSYIDTGMFTVYAGTAPKQTEEVLKLTSELLHEVATKGLTDAEVRKGKEQLKGSLILSLESTGSRMNRMGKNELMLGRHEDLDEMIRKIEAVTPEQIAAVSKRMFSQPFAVAMVGHSDGPLKVIRP